VRRAMTARTIHGPDDLAAAFHVSPETVERLAIYEKLLRRWQKAVNLVAPSTLEAVWHRHFADSAQLLALAPPETRSWIDLGSGGGFPGLVIAILLGDVALTTGVPSLLVGEGQGGGDGRTSAVVAPPTPNPSPQGGGESRQAPRVTLIESDTRKAAFLREVARHTAIPAGVAVDILSIRAESARLKVNAPLPRVICARALAPLEQLLELAAPLSPPGTTALFCKGKGVAGELQEARKTWNFDVALVPSLTDRDGRIAVITNLDRKAND
jgi:16S rRNA (guanine527-N7)-methyltransferase